MNNKFRKGLCPFWGYDIVNLTVIRILRRNLIMKAKELAKILGVSPSTVSVVLNGKPGISDQLRTNLEKKIRELGYGDMLINPGSAVRQAAAPAVPVIAYLIYMEEDVNNMFAFFPAVIQGVENEARSLDMNVVVIHMECECKEGMLKEQLEKTGNVVGCIAQVHEITEKIQRDIDSIDVPCVFMDSYNPELRVSSVNVDNKQAMHQIVKMLKEKGHSRIGYVGENCGQDYEIDRHFSFIRALAALDLPYVPFYDLFDHLDEDRLKEMFDRQDPPTAFVTQMDSVAMWTMDVLKGIGLTIPQEVSVVGFHNTSICELTRPRLTSVTNSGQLMGRECVHMLRILRRLADLGEKCPRLKFYMPTDLVVRDSVGECGK